MKISIDSTQCQGHALCGAHLPDLIDFDEEGYAIVLNENVPADLEGAAQHAFSGCPEGAITLSD